MNARHLMPGLHEQRCQKTSDMPRPPDYDNFHVCTIYRKAARVTSRFPQIPQDPLLSRRIPFFEASVSPFRKALLVRKTAASLGIPFRKHKSIFDFPDNLHLPGVQIPSGVAPSSGLDYKSHRHFSGGAIPLPQKAYTGFPCLPLLPNPKSRTKKEPCRAIRSGKAHKNWRRPTLAQPIDALPSGLQRFTAVFGMGTGGATALRSPEIWRS